MKKLVLAAFLALASQSLAQNTVPLDPGFQISTIPLYAPVSGAVSPDDPTLTVFRPQPGKETGSAVIVAPGGGYLLLASNGEGSQMAEWFANRGFTAFVLKYRFGRKNLYPIPLQDAQRSIRLVRSLSRTYHFLPQRVGMVGFSAGGHLAAVAATVPSEGNPDAADLVDRLSAKPDFLVLGYPWLNAMEPQIKGKITYCSLIQVLSPAQCQALTEPYTPKLHVTGKTPPTFIYSTSDDSVVPVQASVDFYYAMVAAGASAEMHLFRHGYHGSGLGSGDAALDQWPTLLEPWLRDQGLMTPTRTSNPGAGDTDVKTGNAPTLDSPISDILNNSVATAAVASVCGPDFLKSLPKDAMPATLKVLAPYFPKQLSAENLAQIQAAFKKLAK